MDKLREKILEYLHRYYNREKDFYIGAKDGAMAYAAGLMSDSKEPFVKVYDVVTEAVQDFWFGRTSEMAQADMGKAGRQAPEPANKK